MGLGNVGGVHDGLENGVPERQMRTEVLPGHIIRLAGSYLT